LTILPHVASFHETLERLIIENIDRQTPVIMQPIWKTLGKSPRLADQCLDIFIWSNLALTKFIMDQSSSTKSSNITRPMRSMIWLYKMLHDYSRKRRINHARVIDQLSYNTKNDKAFAASGLVTRPYLSSPELLRPRVSKSEIKNIILGGGQNFLSPERRFDAIISSESNLFE
jgi:hypothetical protein